MEKVTKYTIFKTRWGHFGLACCDSLLRRCASTASASARRAGTARLSSALRLRPERSPSKSEYGLLRTCLPLSNPEKVKYRLLINSQVHRFEKGLFKTVQDQITAYFEGACVNFSTEFSHQDTKSQRNQIYKEKTSSLGAFVAKNTDIPIVLDGLSDFCSSVLTACRNIRFGEVVTYSALAKKLGRPAASRAVGNALAQNPLPLIIPCHRVIRSDGQIGGFSAPGGMSTKAKLLKHEQQALRDSKIN